MGQVESAIFEDTPPWDLKHLLKLTDMSENDLNFCWKHWSSNPLTKKGKIDLDSFKKLFEIEGDNEREAGKLFTLLDFDEDERIEFPELMLYLFSTEENLSREQLLRRSYNFYDVNNSGKISKEEMLEALVKMERIDTKTLVETDDGQWLIPGINKVFLFLKWPKCKSIYVLSISDDVQNLFSLMDFGGDGKIKYEEFMRATMHYRRLGMLLSIDFLPAHRKCLLQKMKK